MTDITYYTTKRISQVRGKMPESKMVEQAKTSIKIDPETWKEAKIEAIREGKTVSELVEEAINEWIRERKKK